MQVKFSWLISGFRYHGALKQISLSDGAIVQLLYFLKCVPQKPRFASVGPTGLNVALGPQGLVCTRVHREVQVGNHPVSGAERNTKHQTPSSREVPNPKHQPKQMPGQRRAAWFLRLELGASLELGVWDLELVARALELLKDQEAPAMWP